MTNPYFYKDKIQTSGQMIYSNCIKNRNSNIFEKSFLKKENAIKKITEEILKNFNKL